MKEISQLNNYDKGVPGALWPYPVKTMIEIVDESAISRPYRTLLFFKGARLLYDDFVHQSDALSAGLVSLGIKKGDRVAMLLPNSPQMVLGFYAIWKAGAIAVPIDPLYKEHELEYALTEVDATAVIVLTPFYDAVKNIQARTKIRSVIATNIKEYLPAHAALLFALAREKKDSYRISLGEGDFWFQSLIRKHKNDGRPAVKVKPDDPAVILFSDSTRGVPRGVAETHQTLVMMAMQIHAWLRPVLEEWDDRVMLTVPLFNVIGCVGALGTAMINHSSCVLISSPSDLADVIKNIKKYRPAFMMDVPNLYVGIMNHPLVRSGKVMLDNIKMCIVKAAPMAMETQKRFESMPIDRLLEDYAITEILHGATLSLVSGVNKEMAVALSLPDIMIRVTDVV